jgi:hypothetical protein
MVRVMTEGGVRIGLALDDCRVCIMRKIEKTRKTNTADTTGTGTGMDVVANRLNQSNKLNRGDGGNQPFEVRGPRSSRSRKRS